MLQPENSIVNASRGGQRNARALFPFDRVDHRRALLIGTAAASVAALAWNQWPAADVGKALVPAATLPQPAWQPQDQPPAASFAPAAVAAAPQAEEPAMAVEVAGATPAATAVEVPLAERVMFLTIVGSETFIHWGRIGDRPPRIDASGAPAFAAASFAAEEPATAITETSDASVYGGNERPYGPAPQECPRTLPPGSDQRTADDLKRQSGCRYLSSCDAENQCSWYYQGRD